MKKLYLISLLMMTILAIYSQQSPVVSFTCHDENNNLQRLDSVRIENWTRSWAVTIYYPNLSISLEDVSNGIIEMEFDEEGLAQNIPNPFDGRTRAQLSLSGNEHIVMRVYDITGKAVAYYDGQLEAGKHDFDIVLSTPQTYILQVATSKKTYAIKMVNNGRGGEDKISLHAFNNEVVLKSAKQIMDYDFEPGDCMHYQGFVTVNNAMVMTDPITQNQWNSELITFSLTSQQNTTVPVGIYAGVVGFNNQLYVKPIDVLNDTTQYSFLNFINNLPMGNGTILYHADYTALNNIVSAPIPDELINVTLVTFTDGLDLGSWILNPLFTSETAYLNAVHNRILNDQLGGVNITAYSIGVRGSDLTDTARFRHDLRMLSSDPDHNVFEVANISEVNAQFREVAAQLNQTSMVTTDISLSLPAPDPGTRVRFTFDNVTSATSSYYYIEGTYGYSNGMGILYDIVYEGLTSNSGTMVTGIVQGIFNIFTFTNIKDYLQQSMNTNTIKQWYYIPSTQQWQYNSEFTSSNTISYQQIHNSAVVMLVLDCSSSLGSGFSTVKSAANNFLDILRNSNALYVPTVQTNAATTVTDVSATLNGSVINSGNLIIHECGFVLSLSPNMSNPIFFNTNNTNSFNYTLTGLNPNTTYYYKAFARNNRGIGYGGTQSFTTLSLPAVTTGGVSNVAGYSASCGGTVTSTGNATVSARGVCWSTSHNPTIADNYTNNGTGGGSFTSNITGLNPGTTYYVRAYATNVVGTVYGNEVSFITNSVKTDFISFPDNETMVCYGTALSYGLGATNTGFCWNTSANPTLANNYTDEGPVDGGFTSVITGLNPSMSYYVRAYAINSLDTVYGNEIYCPQATYIVNDTVFLPDGVNCGNGCAYESFIEVSGYDPSSTIQSVDDILYLRIKLEHSYIGDIYIALTCPNGQTIKIMNKYGTNGSADCAAQIPAPWGWQVSSGVSPNAYFGDAYDYSSGCDINNSQNAMGIPWNYCWSNNTAQGYQYANGQGYVYESVNVTDGKVDSTNTTNMTQVYHPDQSFSQLIGCPMNGIWSIKVIDAWAADNGWLTEWELVMNNPRQVGSIGTIDTAVHPCRGITEITDYDGNIYHAVAIGSQCWLRENLRTSHYANGDAIALGNIADTSTAYYYLPEEYTNVNMAGYLYNWNAVMYGGTTDGVNSIHVQGVCPTGWHVPSDEEWRGLTLFLRINEEYVCGNNANNIAKSLADNMAWNVSSNYCAVGNDLLSNNTSGFAAFPAGYFQGVSMGYGQSAKFWSSTPYSDAFAHCHTLNYDNGWVVRSYNENKACGMSVRCVLSEP